MRLSAELASLLQGQSTMQMVASRLALWEPQQHDIAALQILARE
jgi:hypothetical protein